VPKLTGIIWQNLDEVQMTDKWLTIDQIADYLQVSKEKIYKLCQKGKMPASKFVGQWRFDQKEVDQWLRKQRSNKK
jgi:excisionase family DNA binding protein